MRDLYVQIRKDTKKSHDMREMALDLGNKGIELRKQQDELYKRTEFKKKFLKARNNLKVSE